MFIIEYLDDGICAFSRRTICVVNLENENSNKNQEQHS